MGRLRRGWSVTLLAVCVASPAAAFETGVSDNRVSLPNPPGSIDGVVDNARVSGNTGAMTFSVPIDVPQGFEGVTPSLALAYSSLAGDGPVGLGWDLSVPAIERTTSRGLPSYTATDELAYGGGELLVALPDAGTDAAEYRARFERGFLRFRWRDRGDGKQGSWSVEDPHGNVTYYGADAAGTLVDAARLGTAAKGTFRYYPVETVDKLGHRLVYQWAADAAPAGSSADARTVPLLRSLSWVFAGASSQPEYKVTFAYGDRGRVLSDCDPGFETLLAKQLTGLTVTAHGQTRRRMALTYEQVAASGGLTRLARVQSFGVADVADPIVYDFGYTQALGATCADPSCMPVLVETPLTGVNPSLKAGHTTLIDLNGDALPDVIDTTGPKHKILLSKLGADGKASFLPVATSAFGGSYDLATAPYVQAIDVDGDGFTDLVQAQTATALMNGGTAAGDWVSERPLSAVATNAVLGDVLMADGANVRFLDVNGDHRIDALHLGDKSAEVYLGGADGFALDKAHTAGYVGPTFTTGVQLADVNGDGQQDLVQVTVDGLAYWLGLGWGQWATKVAVALPLSAAELPAVELEDLNGDQLADVVVVQGNQVKYALNTTAGTFAAWATLAGTDPRYANLPTVTPDTVTVLFADMNGNGSTDIVWVDAAGKLTYLDLFPIRPNLLTHITNGLGLVTDVRYGTTLEQQGRATAPWPHRLPHAMTVVTELRHFEPVSAATERELYSYTDAYYDPTYKQFRGFARVAIAQEADPAQEAGLTTQTFDLGANDPYRAGLRLGEKLESDGRALYSDAFTHADCPIDGVPDGSGVRFVCQTVKARTLIEGRPEAEWVTTETRYGYDKNGNIATESHLGVTSVGGGACAACAAVPAGLSNGPCGAMCLGDELTIERTWAAPLRATGGWILDALAVEKVSGPAQGPTIERRFYYDGPAFEGLALGKLDKGVTTRVEIVSGTAGETVQLQRFRTDADGNVVETLDALGAPGSASHRTATAYDPTGLRPISTSVFLEDAGGPYELRRTMAYDPVWDELSEESSLALVRDGATTPAASTRRLAYDGLGRLVATAETPSTLDAPDETLTYELGPAPSRVLRRARSAKGGALDTETARCLDGKGRLFQQRDRVADGRFQVSGFTIHNTRGAVTRSYQPYEGASNACDANAPAGVLAVDYRRDAAEREVTTTLPDAALPGAGGQASVTRKEYRPLSVTRFGQNDSPGAGAHTAAPETRGYDGLGRLVSLIRGGGDDPPLVSRFFYDGLSRLASVVDPAGTERRQEYDLQGRPVRVTDPDTGTTTYEYDAIGNQTSRKDGAGFLTRTSFDGLGRPLAEWVEGREAETHVEYSYDVAPAACGADRCPNVAGRLAAIAYPIGTGVGGETYGYDARGWQTRFSRTFGGKTVLDTGRPTPDLGEQRFDVTVAYDNAGRQIGVDYPGGLHVAYEYDGVGRLTRVPGLLEHLTFTPRGDTDEVAFANGVTTKYTADDAGQLAAIRTTDKAGTLLVGLTYAHDREGQIVGIHDEAALDGLPSAEAVFGYDRLHRLISASLDASRPTAEALTYTYDTHENLATRTSSRHGSAGDLGTLSYESAHPHRLAKVGLRAFSFDDAGRTTARGGDTLRWDAWGRLAGVARAGAAGGAPVDVAKFFYGATSERLVKIEDGHRTLHVTPEFDVRDGHGVFYLRVSDQLFAKVETPALAATVLSDVAPATLAGKTGTPQPDGAITAGDAWLAQANASGSLVFDVPTSDVDALLAASTRRLVAGADLKTTFLHVDHAGSVVAATDESGALTFRAAYYPHGDVRASAGAPPEDVRYTGKERDEATGLVAFGGRYADLETGRWLSPDPYYDILVEDDVTGRPDEASGRYGFVANDPVNRTDRDGRIFWWLPGAFIGAATSAVCEMARQHFVEGKINSKAKIFSKAALGFAFGGLSGGLSAAATAISTVSEIATYRGLKWLAKKGSEREVLTDWQEREIRKWAGRVGVVTGIASGVGLGNAPEAAEHWLSSATNDATSHSSATAAAAGVQVATVFSDAVADKVSDKVTEAGVRAVDAGRRALAMRAERKRMMSRLSRLQAPARPARVQVAR
jgi:RHS repeat-associated protein